MNSKQRVSNAIAHRQTDRVAIDYSAREEMTVQLRRHFGCQDYDSLLGCLGVDLRGIGPGFRLPTEPLAYADPSISRLGDDIYCDIWGVGFQLSHTSHGAYMDLARSPLAGAESLEQLASHPWPSPDWWDYEPIPVQLARHEGYWAAGHSRGIFEISWFLRGFEGFMLDLALRPDWAVAVMDRVQEYLFERTRRILAAGNTQPGAAVPHGRIDMMEYNDHVGSQRGLLLSPAMWREHLKPRMAQFVGLCRRFGAKVRYHSCGGIRPIIPDLIEIGVDVLNPIQTQAEGMDPRQIKAEFGPHITLNGGIDTQDLLPFATRDEVYSTVSRLLDDLGREGGYILAPSHVFQGDVPVENVLAVYEAALGRKL